MSKRTNINVKKWLDIFMSDARVSASGKAYSSCIYTKSRILSEDLVVHKKYTSKTLKITV